MPDHQFKWISFNSSLGKYFGIVQTLKDHERAHLPDHLRSKTILTTDFHEEPEDAGRAVDKWVSIVGSKVRSHAKRSPCVQRKPGSLTPWTEFQQDSMGGIFVYHVTGRCQSSKE